MVGPILRSTGVGDGKMAVAGSTGRRDGMVVCSPRERDCHLDDCRDEKSFGELKLAVRDWKAKVPHATAWCAVVGTVPTCR